MKKITALVLAFTLALSLTACGGSSDTGTDSHSQRHHRHPRQQRPFHACGRPGRRLGG